MKGSSLVGRVKRGREATGWGMRHFIRGTHIPQWGSKAVFTGATVTAVSPVAGEELWPASFGRLVPLIFGAFERTLEWGGGESGDFVRRW